MIGTRAGEPGGQFPSPDSQSFLSAEEIRACRGANRRLLDRIEDMLDSLGVEPEMIKFDKFS